MKKKLPDLINERQQNKVPEFFDEKIVFCDKMLIHRKRHYLILARNLKFYEFSEKQLVNSIDLSETCLKKVAENVLDYKGPKGKLFENVCTRSEGSVSSTGKPVGLIETSELQTSALLEEEPTANVNIFFGKYVYRNFDINKVYLLIRCWDKLVIIALSNHTLVTEYEDVKSCRIVHGKEKFEALLEIKFENNKNTQYADFQIHENLVNLSAPCNIATDRISLKKLLERVRCTKSELQLYKSITQKEFDALRDQETFGCNYIRSDQIEEKPMISRCGDMWLRFVTNDTIVFGVPLINNCSTNSLTIIQNLKPILKINDSSVGNVIYKYRLYQLRVKLEDLETAETFFQTEDEELRSDADPWINCELPHMLPTSFAVLLIAIHISQLLLLKECPLILYFEIEKGPSGQQNHSEKNLIYEQHLFLKNLNISHILLNRQRYELLCNPTCFHQDILAAAMINKEVILRIKFLSLHNAVIFEQLITKKFNFTAVFRKLTPNEYEMDHENTSGSKGVEDNKTNLKHFVSSLYFDKNPTSLMFGSMVLKAISNAESEDGQIWKLYLYNNEKAFVCLKLIFSELLLINCKINSMEFLSKEQDCREGSLHNIKNALAGEIEGLKHLNECNEDVGRRKTFDELMKSQLNSDALSTSVKWLEKT